MTQNLTPKDIVNELDRFIVGQNDAKRAVAIALRNRWRRQQLPANMREEVLPKNILMIGSTGVGKTEIARRLAKLVQAPFIKVEATKFTEIGYVGRDVEQIIRDLVDNAIQMEKSLAKTKNKDKAQQHAEETLLDVLVGKSASPETRNKFHHMLKQGELDDREVEISINDISSTSMPSFDIPGIPGAQMGMINIGDMLGKLGGSRTKTIKTHVKEGLAILIKDAAEQLIDQEQIVHDAIENVEQNGIVFLDEIDKICAQREHRAADVSREGVQRDLLPLIEGTNVSTKHGNVKTDHILFITSGAFHLSKPSDLLPELQGRLPIRVELKPLTADDFMRILTEPEYNLIRQACALLETENVTLEFQQESLQEMANQAAQINEQVENIGARRLHTILEKLLEEISFNAPEHQGQTITITKDIVIEKLGSLVANQDLSKFIL